jgi:hypothetical protein
LAISNGQDFSEAAMSFALGSTQMFDTSHPGAAL